MNTDMEPLNRVGMARCAVRATERSVRWRKGEHERHDARFDRLTLRSATGTSQRDVPTRIRFMGRGVRDHTPLTPARAW